MDAWKFEVMFNKREAVFYQSITGIMGTIYISEYNGTIYI